MKQKPIQKKKQENVTPFNWITLKWPITLLVTIIAYYKILQLGYTNNDDVILIINQHNYLSDWSNFFELFKHSVFQKNDTFYRPILMVYFMLMNHLAEPDNFLFYHLSLLILHIINIILIDSFLKKYIENNETLFWLVLLFAIHPALTMTVAWIPGVNDLLLTTFCLLYFKMLDKILGNSSRANTLPIISIFVLFFIVLLTKETGLFLPFATILVLLYNGNLKSHIKSLGFISVLFFIAIIAWYLLRKNALGQTDSNTFTLHTIQIFFERLVGISFYFSKAIAPVNLCVWPLWESANYIFILISIIIFVTLVILNKHRNNRLIFFGLVWMLIFLLPNFFSTTTTFVLHEHRLYMPLIGFLIIVSQSVFFSTQIVNNIYRRILLAGILSFFIYQITEYVPSFNNAVSFNKSGITRSPNNAYLNICYGVALSDSNQVAEALPYFHKAYKLDSSLKNVRLYIARYDLIPNKKYDSAKIFLLQETLKTPNNADNYYALSTIGFETKDYLFCEEYLEKYIQL
ncbi:MAG: hypothetical protein RL065_84, partial [Bacteroidota bacterium]